MTENRYGTETLDCMETQVSGPAEVVEEEEDRPTKPAVILHISHDRMEAMLELQHTSTNTSDPVLDDLMEAIAEKGIVFGIREEEVAKLCRRPLYNEPVLIARGKKAETGADGYLTFLVETERQLRPKEREDGTVDFRDLGFIQSVQQGQSLCEVHAPTQGEDGMDIYGNVLEGKFGRTPIDPAGKNTEYNQEGTLLLAACDGSVEVKNGIASVIQQLRINGSVDNSTGDIHFVGNIYISGDVLAGFQVVSQQGSIAVKGNVEGAILEAAENITVSEGINGMDRGVVTAGQNLKCRFIQSCTVKTGQDIFVESIMHSTITCGRHIEMSGAKTRIIGGTTTLTGHLLVRTIGTDSHVPTVVNVNSGKEFEPIIQALNKQLKDYNAEELKLQQLFARMEDLRQKNLITPEMKPTLELARNSYRQLLMNRNRDITLLAKAKEDQLEAQENAKDSYIQCRGRIHVGTTLTFGPLIYAVQQSFVNSRVILSKGEIRILNM